MLIELTPPDSSPVLGSFAQAVIAGLDASLAPLGEVLLEEVSQRFETGTDPQGRFWEEWRDRELVLKARRKRGFTGTRVLIAKAILKNSFAARVQPEQRRVSVGPGGAAAVYAPTHQFGRGRILARPVLPIGAAGPPRADLVRELRETIADSLRIALARWRASKVR